MPGQFFALTIACSLAGFACAPGAHASDRKTFDGVASYYGADYHGRVASGAKYDPEKLTCAHRTLPFGTKLRVSDRRNGRSVVVTVNDRGPFTHGRVLDLSLAAARELRMTGRGLISVHAELQ
jgi:rare lipoprotein A